MRSRVPETMDRRANRGHIDRAREEVSHQNAIEAIDVRTTDARSRVQLTLQSLDRGRGRGQSGNGYEYSGKSRLEPGVLDGANDLGKSSLNRGNLEFCNFVPDGNPSVLNSVQFQKTSLQP